MAVRLRLMGSAALEREGETFPLPFERRSQLVAYLALKAGWVGRAELAALLWPDQEEKHAYSNLRKTLFRLRSLPWAPEVQVQGGALRLDAATDVAEFEAAVREGRIAEATRLGHGELLPQFDDDASEAWSSWVAFERERLRAAWRGAALARLGEDPPSAEGIAVCARLLEADPLDEAALRSQMAFLAREGQAAQARQAYRDFVARLANELGIEPSSELAALHDTLAAAAVAAPRIAPSDDGFVGRSVELRQLASLLAQDDCRLVTILGPGGVGKTRLARRALAEMGAGYGHEAFFVRLEDAATAGDIASRIGRELGVTIGGRDDPLGEIVRRVGERRTLLVLDNFEHLTGEVAVVESLLERCAGLEVLVTSRARLGLPLEQLLPLEGLPSPEPEDHDRFDAFDAVRLFVKTAKRVEPGLVAEAEAEAIADICRQVEGLPLAIELAASWARVLSCEAIAAQLRDGLQLLRSADAGRPARHASMQVVFDESWRLLAPAERDALARLAVFEGGFTAEAARAVAQASLPVLAALADKSLLRKDQGRLSMHPLVQQLAASRLGRDGGDEKTRQAHAQHFHRMMAHVRTAASHGEPETLRALERELSNCRAAWRWTAARGSASALQGSLFTILFFFDHRFRLAEGLALLQVALESPTARADPRLEALLRATGAHLLYRLDRYPEAIADATAALAASESNADHDTRYQSVKVLGGCALRTGRFGEAKAWYQRALELATSGGDPLAAAGMLDNLALVEKRLGNYDEALRLSHEALMQQRQGKHFAGEALCLNNLGTLCFDRREYDAARAHLHASLALCERHGLVNTQAMALANLVELETLLGEAQPAERHARQALEITHTTGNRGLEGVLQLDLARLAIQRHDYGAARAALAAGMEVAIATGNRSYLYNGLACFTGLLAAEGEADCARAIAAYCIAQPDISAPERDAIRARFANLPSGTGGWSGPGIDELFRRVVLERDVAHGPLVAAVRSAIAARETASAGR